MIPKVFHRIWLGGPMPEHLQAFGDTWKRLHKGWMFSDWDEAAIESFGLRNKAVYDDAEAIAPMGVGQLRADVARYEILERIGGVYIDADMECLAPIDALAQGVSCFAGWEAPGRWVNNAVLGAQAGHPFLRALVYELAANVEAHKDPDRVRPNVLSGPQYLTPIYMRPEIKRLVTVYPKDFFYPYLWNELHRGRDTFHHSYAVHHWDNMRKRKAMPR